MPVSKKRRKLANASAAQATKKRLLKSPLAHDEADKIVLQIRIGLEAIRSGHRDETALLNLQSVILLTEMLTAEGQGTLSLDTIRETGRSVVHLLERGNERSDWTVPASLVAGLTTIVNEYDRMMHQLPLQAVLAATGKLERLEKEDPEYFRCARDNNCALS
ncbi:hypothetical protein LMG28727_07651 [Paraburkholderia kirstenboschensis]|uniref:hypothetical protein n=1 Tax=Paraburkholderia kirstenboschensis TaxID=1245436 RepID=UPI000B02A7D3|nr:hypothetical protein [Paraburkholderia kirstenboschensis]CAD6562108.1 hypothetical protein LMG28727_07651 [Paraburkholderia kirstenboschensis]